MMDMMDFFKIDWNPDIPEYARKQRNQLLEIIDKINPVWYGTLTDEQKQELVVYRQALLDVPQQPGFPATISWPEKPSWL